MKKVIFIFTLLLLFENASAQISNNPTNITGGKLGHNIATQVSSGDAGNGGGGVQQNGRYMTFYSYGFYTEREELSRKEIPQLNDLINFFNNFPHLSPATRAKVTAKLIPTSKRRYYKVQKDHFTQEVRARLIEEFSRVTETNVENLALFAITDTNNKITYLLPEFYELTPTEQKAILYHEAYWLLHPNSHVSQVIDAEVSFQAFWENPTPEKLFKWIEYTASTRDKIQSAVTFDIEEKNLEGLLVKNRLYLKSLLGKEFLDCMKQHGKDENAGPKCKDFFQLQLYKLREQYPQSFVLNIIEDHFLEAKFELYMREFGTSRGAFLTFNFFDDDSFLTYSGHECTIDVFNNYYIDLSLPINLLDNILELKGRDTECFGFEAKFIFE